MYLKTSRSFVNLSAVEHVEPVASVRGVSALKLTSDKNRELGVISGAPGEEAVNLEKITAPIIPAGPLVVALAVTVDAGEARPGPEHLEVRAVPLVGWRLVRGVPEPVLAFTPPEGAALYLAAPPHGFVSLEDGRVYNTREQLQDHIVELSRGGFDRDHQVEHKPQVVGVQKATGGQRHASR